MAEKELNLSLILEGCLKENRNSQARLYKYYFGYGLSVALRYAKGREEALEILNDAFLKVFTKLDQYDSAYPFKVWFRKILVHTAIDYHRKHHKNPDFVELDALNESPVIEQENYPDLNPDQDVLPVLQKLTPIYRMVFNLFVMEGYKHQEIAEKLNISVSASRSNLTRAKVRLRKMLDSSSSFSTKSRENG
ncbi:MAG: sigma-70 family RNA polymerase sigma factor [Saprospiraceae bacterium]|nr:sigma-70 family RNA polymerase sigma factor [Saprospiraceae bacterium]